MRTGNDRTAQLFCHGREENPYTWDVTVPDTFADAHVTNSAREAGAAAEHAATNKTNKYSRLMNTHIFYPVAIETAGTWHYQAVELVKEIGKRTTNIAGDERDLLLIPTDVHSTAEGGTRFHFKVRSLPASPRQPLHFFATLSCNF